MPDGTRTEPFEPVERIVGAPDAGVLFLCDHASNRLPPGYGDLGLPAAQFARHIAYDIGAADMTRALADAFGAPAVLSTFSRLLIDPNRGGDDPTLVMRLSDGALVPGNARVGPEEIEKRRRLYWAPYRAAAAETVAAMRASGVIPAIVSLHSFTPRWKTFARPWHVAVLWDRDPRMAPPFIAALRAEGDLAVGDNEPYDGALEHDTIDDLATREGLASLLIEVRQDLVASREEANIWAGRLARLLRPVLAMPECHRIEMHGSRAYGPQPKEGA